MSEINITDFGFHNPNYFLIPFLVALKFLNTIFFEQTHFVLASFNGFLLSLAFLSTYLVIRDLHLGKEHEHTTKLSAIIGALFFIFVPVMIYNWQKSLYTWHHMAVYPLLIWFFMQYIKKRNSLYLIYGLFLTLLFSVNFSVYMAAPTLFSFLPLTIPLIVVVAVLQRKIWWLLRGVILFLILFILLHSFHLIPQTTSLFSHDSNLYQIVFTETGKVDRGLNYFEGVRPMVKLVYNVTGFPQYFLYKNTGTSPFLIKMLTTYGINILPAFMTFPAVVIFGLMFSKHDVSHRKYIFLSTVLLFFIALFLITANVFGSFGPRGYAQLFSLPGFAMFRSFYGVFVVPYIFLYALVVGLSLNYVLKKISRPFFSFLLTSWLVMVLLGGAIPFLNGSIVNVIMPDTNKLTLSNRLPSNFLAMVEDLKKLELDAKFLTLPLTQYEYQVVDDQHGGAYMGPSPLGILAGRHTFSGINMFSVPKSSLFSADFLLEHIQQKDYTTLNRFFSLLNIGFIFENSSPIAYRQGFTGYPYSKEVWKAFPDSTSFHDFVLKLGYRPIMQKGMYTVYTNPDVFLPHIYVPRRMVTYRSPDELASYVATEKSYDLYTAFYYDQHFSDVSLTDTPLVEVKKINEMKYNINIKNIKQSFPLVFSHAWHPGWKLLVAPTFKPIPDTYHQHVNEYANSWYIDLRYLQKNFPDSLKQTTDGGYDLELILYFAPQRIFHINALISSITLIGTISWLGYLKTHVFKPKA